MAHSPKPFFRTARNAWFVQLGKTQTRLCDGPKTSITEKSAWAAFHQLMTQRSANDNAPAPAGIAPPQRASGITIAVLFDKYLEWCQKHRSPRTYDGYVWHLQRFCDHLKTAGEMPALGLKPFHVIEWLDAHPAWGQTYRRNATAAVQRAYNWAEELGYIESNPVRKIKKPAPKRREQYIRPEDWETISSQYKDSDPFRLFLEFCWHTGCRPQEARHIEPRHVRLDKAVIAIPPEEAKGRKKWRLIRLEGRSLEMVREQMEKNNVKLFVNCDGVAWTSYAINCRFCRLKEKLGTKFCNYQFRHGFANRMLESGADHLTVAALLGHSDGTMLAKVYSHLDSSDAHLREVLRRANGSGEADVAKH